MFEGDANGAGASGDDGNAAANAAASAADAANANANANAGQQGSNNSGGSSNEGSRRSSRGKPQFDEEQNRWIGGLVAREEDKRRTVETERDAEREKARTLTERTETLERELRQSRAENAVIAAAAKLRADNPAHVYRMIRDDLEYGDDGKPKDVDATMEKFKKDNPKYFGGVAVSGADGGKGGGADGNAAVDMDDVLRTAWQNSKIHVKR